MMKYKPLVVNLKGQALITLLIFAALAMIITSGAVAVTIINSQSAGEYAIGDEAYMAAEAGAENAIMTVVRNPSYTVVNQSVPVGSLTATINVSGTSTKTIVSEGISGNFHRKVQVVGSFSNNAFSVSTWSEIN